MQKHLLVIESNTTGTGLLALQKARSLGFSPIFFTNDPRRYKGLEHIECPVVVCDTNSVNTLKDTITAHMDIDQLLGITTTSEFYLEIVAELANAYHLPGNSPGAVKACRNKAQTRLALEAAGVRQPRFAIIHSASNANSIPLSLHPPCIVKPADDTGSNEVRLCQTEDERTEQVMRILSMTTNVRGQRNAQTVLVEEFVDAPEYSVEMFTWQGETRCIGITEKSVTGFPYFVECRHIFPANLSSPVAEEIQATVRNALKVIGITHGATHTEVKLTSQGCMILEINARLAGGMIPIVIHYVTGTDLVELQLRATVGLYPDLSIHFRGYAGIQFLISPIEGIWRGVRGIETIQKSNNAEQAVITTPVGSRVTPPRSAYDRLGYVIARADTYEEVTTKLQSILDNLEFLIDSQIIEE